MSNHAPGGCPAEGVLVGEVIAARDAGQGCYNRVVDTLHHLWSSALQPLAGGMLIGAAAALLWLLDGRVAGISGISGGLFGAQPDDRAWRWAFLLGLVAGGAVMWRALPSAFAATTSTATSFGLPIAAGLLVGVGTTLANGCTSGHGVCGISRWSRRSLAATATFMAAGVVTALVAGQLLGPGAS